MNSRSKPGVLDDGLEALGRYERRRLLLRLFAAEQGEDPHLDFSRFDRNGSELDPLVSHRHLHLPTLEERGFVRWDRENHRVTAGPRFHELEPFLRLLREIGDELPGKWV